MASPNKNILNVTLATIGILIFTTLMPTRKVSFAWAANPLQIEGDTQYYKTEDTNAANFIGTTIQESNSLILFSGIAPPYHSTITAYNGKIEGDYTRRSSLHPFSSSITMPTEGNTSGYFFAQDINYNLPTFKIIPNPSPRGSLIDPIQGTFAIKLAYIVLYHKGQKLLQGDSLMGGDNMVKFTITSLSPTNN